MSSWELWVVLWTYKSNHTWQTWYMTNTYIFKQHRLWRTKNFVHWNPIPKCPTPAKPDYPAHLRWHIQIEYTQHHHHVGCVGWRKVFEKFSVFRPLLSKFFLWWISKISTIEIALFHEIRGARSHSTCCQNTPEFSFLWSPKSRHMSEKWGCWTIFFFFVRNLK